jgi:hypothetical protein
MINIGKKNKWLITGAAFIMAGFVLLLRIHPEGRNAFDSVVKQGVKPKYHFVEMSGDKTVKLAKTKGHLSDSKAIQVETTSEYHDASEPYISEGIEDIRRQIYEFQIEYTDDIALLDEIIRKTDKTPDELWTGNWVSADTWKRRKDRFSVEPVENGKFKLFPDRDDAKLYDYDPENREFIWQMDYYGKIITSKAKFIDEDTLVLMKISGTKVALDIYRKNDY